MPSTAKYMKRYRLDRATGIRRTVPPGRALAHLETLHDAGMTWHAIARAAGVAPTTVTSAVHHMRTGRALHAATEARWLAVPYIPPTASRGSLRRRRDVGVRAGGRRRSTPLRRTLHDGPHRPSRGCQAHEGHPEGWVPPMAWDDIDDPLEEPKGVATGRAA